MPEPLLKTFFKAAKNPVIEHTEPSEPNKALQIQEQLTRIEETILHPNQALKDIVGILEAQNSFLDTLVKNTLITRQFRDEPIALGATLNYHLRYHRHLYVYLYSNTGFTLAVSNGASLAIPANYWTNVSYPEGTYFTASGGSDITPQLCIVRACDVPLLMPTQQIAGTIAATQSGTWSVNQAGTWTVQPGNTANTTPWLFAPQATTAGGSIPSHTMSAATTNATSLKASAGLVYGVTLSNVNAAARFVKLYDKASAPTVGTDVPKTTIEVLPNSTVVRVYPVGMQFLLGIAWAATAGIADTDATAIGLNDMSIDIDYK